MNLDMVKFFLFLVSTVFLTVSQNCQKQDLKKGQEKQHMPTRSIEAVLEAHTDSLLAVPGIIGTGIGEFEGRPCIKVMLTKDSDQLRRRIPSQLEGYKVIIDVTGEIKALEKP